MAFSWTLAPRSSGHEWEQTEVEQVALLGFHASITILTMEMEGLLQKYCLIYLPHGMGIGWQWNEMDRSLIRLDTKTCLIGML